MFKSCLGIIRPNERCYYYQYSFYNFYDIFYVFYLVFFLQVKKKNPLRKIIQIMMVITGMVGMRIKGPSNFKPQDLIMFKLYLAIIQPNGRYYYYQYSFYNFMIFFILFYLLFFLQIKKILRKIIQIIITGMVGTGIKRPF